VAITGLGVLTPIGRSAAEVRDALLAGRHGIRPVGLRVTTPSLRALLAATLVDPAWCDQLVPQADDPGLGDDPCVEVALPAAREAWSDAGLGSPADWGRQVALVLGTSAGGMISRSLFQWTPAAARQRRHRLLRRSCPAAVTSALASELGVDGPIVTISTACSSSTNAVVHGRDLLLAGLADVVIAGGVEVLVEEVLGGFCAMGAISPAPCAPFSLPLGLTVGEGAGFVVLERWADACDRGAHPHGLVLGAALAADGWHPTAPRPDGTGLAQAMSGALADAATPPERVGYLNAHGSGTEANDAAEWRAIKRCLGAAAERVPVSSTKSFLGHGLGAAGVIELVATVLCQRAQVVHPTLGWSGGRGPGPPDPVAEPVPRTLRYDVALKASAGFGGANAALVVATPEAPRPPPIDADEVWIVGIGVLGPCEAVGFDEALRADCPVWDRLADSAARRWGGCLPELSFARLVRGIDLRGMPGLAQRLLVAVQRALADASIRIHGSLRERTGLFVGAWQPGWDVVRSFWGSIAERGYDKPSTHAFARLVLNAPAGLVATGIGLRGPQTVVAGGRGATLSALALARAALAHRRDADRIVVASAAELTEEMLDDHAVAFPDEPADRRGFPVYHHDHGTPVLGEGAAALVLAAGRALQGTATEPLARVAGTGTAGAGHLTQALGDALAEAGWGAADLDGAYGSADGSVGAGQRELSALLAVVGPSRCALPLCNPAPVMGTSASLDAFALAAAVQALRHRRLHPAAALAAPEGHIARRPSRPAERLVVLSDHETTGAWAVALEAWTGDRRSHDPPPVVLSEAHDSGSHEAPDGA